MRCEEITMIEQWQEYDEIEDITMIEQWQEYDVI